MGEGPGGEPADHVIQRGDVVLRHAFGAVELEGVDEVETCVEVGHVGVVDRMHGGVVGDGHRCLVTNINALTGYAQPGRLQ